MTVNIGGQGDLGLAFETTLGTYVAPTKFIPIRSETLQLMEDKIYRTPIMGVADRSTGVQGFTHAEGEIEYEVTSDALVYFAYLARHTITKTGSNPYTYVFKPGHFAAPSTAASGAVRRTASITVDRNNHAYGYLGMSVVRTSFSFDNGMLVCTHSVIGLDEAGQSTPTPTFSPLPVYGPGKNVLSIAAVARADIDTFTCDIENNGQVNPRVKSGRQVAFINWGEREVSGTYDHDFENVNDYTAFTAQTVQALQIQSTNNAVSDRVTLAVNAGITDAYPHNLSSLGDLIRASVTYHGIYVAANTPPDVYTLTVITSEGIT